MQNMQKNPAQEEAIHTVNGPMLLIRCPGSGKTTTMLRRIDYMIRNGVDPKHILMVTFTDAAATEMKKRFRTQYGNHPVTFCTIHALCLRVSDRGRRRNRERRDLSVKKVCRTRR